MLFLVVVAVTLAACQGAKSEESLFAGYFRSASDLEELSLQEHAEFAFRGPSDRGMPSVVSTLDDVTVYNNGFAYVNFYSEKSCSGDIIAVAGKPTNVCIVAYEDDTSATPTGSYKYTCNAGTVYTTQYKDTSCTDPQISFQENVYCENLVGRYGSQRGFCNEDPSVLPLPSANFATEIEFASPSSCDATIDEFESFLIGHCYKLSASTSVMYSATDVMNYNNAGCTGTATTTTPLSQTCVPVTTYPVTDSDLLARIWTSGEVPTGMPFGPGYVWVDLYQSRDCQGEVSGQEGHPTGVCLTAYDENGAASGSYQYNCDNVNEYYTEYSDLACTTVAANSTKPLACQNIIGRFASGQGRCNADASKIPNAVGKFATETLYDSPNECTTISGFNAFLNDNCFHNGNKGFAYQWPNVTFYDDAECSTTPSSESRLPQTCNTVTQFPANTHVASQWSLSDIPYAPTGLPTYAPTPMPTPVAYSAGYLYVNFYHDKGCTGEIVAVTGRPTDTCLVAYEDPDSTTPTGSYKFTCYGDQSMTQKYSDTNCQVQLGNTTNLLGCRASIGRFGSAEGICNSDSSRLPLPASNFTTAILYDSLTTCDASIVQFESFEDKHCFSNGGGSSFKYEFPTAFYYTGGTCAEPAVSNETLSTSCVTTTETPIALANKWTYGDVNFGGSSSETLTTAEIAGIAAGGAVALVAAAAGAYYFLGSSAASGAATAMGGGANPMVSAV